MLRPMMLVGVGGSGGKTLQLLHRELRWRLRDAGWTEGVPAGWQFIHIDVPAAPDTTMGNEASLVNSSLVGGRYIGLAPEGVTYKAIDNDWINDARSPELAKVATWRPRAEDVNVAIGAGAGQFRTIGRVVSLSQANLIRDALSSARTKLSDPGIHPQLQRLSIHLGAEAAGISPDPQAVVISSMAGGSGAGMFLDVADIIRAANPAGWGDSSIGILYTADVFSEIPELARQGVMPNSLAALCEMMNGYWNNTQPGDEYRALERAGIPAAAFERRGLRYPLFVGRSNNSVTFPDQTTVYEASAKTLAAFMTSPAAQNSVYAYLAGNWVNSSVAMQDATPFKDSVKGTVASAMGMGSMSLGRDRFARYTAQRLARSGVEHALRAHTVGRKVPEEITFEAARDEVAVSQLEWFINQCGLDELGEEHNQVLDALRPTNTDADEAARAAIRQQVGQFTQAQPNEYANMIIQHAEHQRPTYVSATDQALRQQASIWVGLIVSRLEAATLESLSRSGLEATVEILRRLETHVRNVINDLTNEISKYQGMADRMAEGVSGALNEFGTAAMVADNELIPKGIGRAVKTLAFGLEARLRQTACILLDDFARNELRPLLDASSNALGGLRVDEHPPAGAPSLGIEDWPTAGIIPRALFPALNERLVEDVETFPKSFEDQLANTVRDALDPDRILSPRESERLAVGEILTGRGRDLSVGDVLLPTDTWWPQMLNTQRPATAARYQFRLGGADLLERAEDWTHRRDTALGEFVHESLRSYVEVDDMEERAHRRTRVLNAFQEVLAVSPPLVQINNAIVGAVHGVAPSAQYHFTSIPFAQTDIEPELVAMTQNAGQPDDVLAQLSKAMGTGEEQRIEIITTLSAPVQPIVLQSVIKPIAEQWTSSRDNNATREQFWRWRRARALPEFIPASPEVIASMTRGWFLGRLLGDLTWDKQAIGAEAVQIYNPEYQRDEAFPFPYLGPSPTGEMDLLPAVLESMGLSMLESQIRGNIEPLRAYSLLRSLGEDAPQHLRNWVQFGNTAHGKPPLPRAWQNADKSIPTEQDATPADRQRAVLAYLDGRKRNYVDRLDENPVTRASMLTQPRWLDLRDILDSAFAALHSETANISTSEADDDGD